ncbi:hypothetical protein BGY98DRAFT_1182259 [Russula aff. rugulosa BPL654]|nr:hypothetical protein BGY98DRAFT_1182259 [Russula aff. rugulosa BPL654]
MPVADMLAHLPPLALIIDHVCGNFDVSEGDDSEERLLLALKQYGCSESTEAHHRRQRGIPSPGTPRYCIVTPSARGQEYHLETIGNTSSVAYESTTPCTDWLRPSNEISITHNRHGPCHTGTYSDLEMLMMIIGSRAMISRSAAGCARNGTDFRVRARLEKLNLDFLSTLVTRPQAFSKLNIRAPQLSVYFLHFDPNWYKAWHNWALANLEAVNHLLNQGEAKAADVMGTTLVPHIIPASKLSIIISKQRLRRVYLKDNDGNGYHLEGYVQNVLRALAPYVAQLVGVDIRPRMVEAHNTRTMFDGLPPFPFDQSSYARHRRIPETEGMLAVADIAARMQHAAGGDSDSVLIHLGNELHKAMIFKEFQEILRKKRSLEPLGALDFP